jgi:flagellar motor switch protein FliM
MEVVMGDTRENVHLAFPHEMLTPVIRQLGPVVESRKPSSKDNPPTATVWNPELGQVRLPVEAQWVGLQVTARNLMELKVGDVLPVEARYGEQVQIQLAKVSKYVGRLGKCGRHWAVQLTEAIPN